MGIVLILLVILPGRHGRQCAVRSGCRDGVTYAWKRMQPMCRSRRDPRGTG
ncbi:hypothetical protein J2Y70_002513 [Xanthomonas translucens]|nr:hypothetical protein [Xanthomonas translucens]